MHGYPYSMLDSIYIGGLHYKAQDVSHYTLQWDIDSPVSSKHSLIRAE